MKKKYENQKKQIEESNKKIIDLENKCIYHNTINEELIVEKNKNKKLEDIIKENEKKFNECINNKDNELKIKKEKINKKQEKMLELAKKLEENKKEMNEYKKKYNDLLVNLKNFVHNGIKCEKCFVEPIIGYRYKCSKCENYNLCQKCEEKNAVSGEHSHFFIKIRKECKEYNNFINNDYVKDNNIIINDINFNNKNEIYEKKEDKNDSSPNIINKFLDEKDRINKFINELIKNYSNEKETYESKLKEKENEIKLFKQVFPLEILNEKEKILNINFITDDENIHYSIICKNTSKLNQIIERFYNKYPQYKKFKNVFRFKGKEINMSITLEENNINNNDIISIKSYSIKEQENNI